MFRGTFIVLGIPSVCMFFYVSIVRYLLSEVNRFFVLLKSSIRVIGWAVVVVIAYHVLVPVIDTGVIGQTRLTTMNSPRSLWKKVTRRGLVGRTNVDIDPPTVRRQDHVHVTKAEAVI